MSNHNPNTTSTDMVGRTNLLAMVEQAVSNAHQHSSALYFFGAAGMGKTRLLQEIGNISRRKHHFFRSKIVDLHHSERQSQIGIETFIAKSLDPHDDYFKPFWDAKTEMETERGLGVKGDSVSVARQRMTDAFITCYTRMAQNKPIVLTFDTVELLQQELDKAQTICGVSAPEASSVQWFKNVLPRLKNTVAIFAGRPGNKEQWLATLNEAFGKEHVKGDKSTELVPLNEKETKDLIRVLTSKYPELDEQIDDDLCTEIHLRTNGRPIYISLYIELLGIGVGVEIADLLPIGTFDKDKPKIHAEAGKQITTLLATRLPEGYEKHMLALYFLAYAHQGLDAKLLDYLTDYKWPLDEIKQLIDTLRDYTFIKHHPEDEGTLFFHDELYDLFDLYYSRQDARIGKNLFGRIQDYYQAQYDALDTQIKTPNPIRTATDITERQKLVKQREEVSIPLLYYKLQINPYEGYYHYYWWWDLTAIHANNLDYDMRLRDLVLRFMARYLDKKSPAYNELLAGKESSAGQLDVTAVHRDCAVRWVRRLIAENRHVEARQAARKAQGSDDSDYLWDAIDDILYQADLLSAWGEATSYSPTNKTFIMLHEAEGLLETLLANTDLEQNEKRRYQRVLARTYNALGFAHRVKNQLTTAYRYYQKALYVHQQTGVMAEMTTTMVNLAYTYALLGAFDEARVLIEKSIEIREQLGDIYGVVISLNVYALIKLEEDMPINAISLSDQALDLIKKHGWEDSRAYFLIHRARGRILRKQANLFERKIYSKERASTLYEKAGESLTIVENSFTNKPFKSKDRLAFDIALEQGRLHRDLMRFTRLTSQNDTVAQTHFKASSFSYNEAKEMAIVAKMQDEVANVLEDMAVLHEAAGQLEKARNYLNQAKTAMDDVYKPKKGIGFEDIQHPVTQSWFTLGKMFLTESKLLQAEAEQSDDVDDVDVVEEQFLAQMRLQLLAAACFERASPFPSDLLRGMRSTRIALYNRITLHGTQAIAHVMESIDELYDEYDLTDKMRRIRTYVAATLGALYTENIDKKE